MASLIESILVPIVGVAPGFVLVSVHRRNRHAPDPSDARFAATALVASILPHALFLFWTLHVLAPAKRAGLTAVHPVEALLWTLVVVLIAPALLGLVTSHLVEAGLLQPLFRWIGWTRAARTRTAWDWVFQPAEPLWLKIQLRNGEVVCGVWDKGSFATLGPEPRQLYIAEPYDMTLERFPSRRPDAGGLWIDGSEIVTMEVFKAEEDKR